MKQRYYGFLSDVSLELFLRYGKKQEKGRDTSDVIIMVVTFVLAYLFLLYGAQLFDGQVDQNFGTWLIAGGLIGLGMIVPGLSPSNFLVYMGLYKAMADGFKEVRLEVIVLIGIGGILCVLGLSKSWITFSQRHIASYSISF